MNIETLFPHARITCPCGCGFKVIKPGLVFKLAFAQYQEAYGYHITSWCRCESHNKERKGSRLSSHMDGEAVHILTANETDRYDKVAALIKAGFKRILIGKGHIHVDISETKTSPSLMIGG